MPTKPYTVALLVNLAQNAQLDDEDSPEDALAELDKPSDVEAYAKGIRSVGCDVHFHEGGLSAVEWLRELKPDICFNVCEGLRGESREAHTPAILEMLGLRYTGPAPLAAALTQDKPTTKRVLHFYGMPTPLFQVFNSPDDTLRSDLTYPLFVKPQHEGTGMGIKNDSVARNEKQLRDAVARVIHQYKQPALVESYIEGKDITCGLIGNGDDVHIFPITEVDFSGYPADLEPVYSSLHKNELDYLYRNKCPAPLGDKLTQDVRRLAHQTFLVTGSRDYGRVDFRLTDDGKLYILEINALPGITPRSDLTLMAQVEGISHTQMVGMVMSAALKRYRM